MIINTQDKPFIVFKNNEDKWRVELTFDGFDGTVAAPLFTANETLTEEQQKEQVENVFKNIQIDLTNDKTEINIGDYNE